MNQNHGIRHEVLYRVLDQQINRCGLTELHTHLMGMGSADFWVSRIMKVFLTNYSAATGIEIYFSLSTILEADGFGLDGKGLLRMNEWKWEAKMACAKLEARMFDGLSGNMAKDFPFVDGYGHAITNTRLMELLNEEKDGGQLHGLVRNWFEFLDSAGMPVSNVDILDTYRGNFSPLFYPGRFKMKEAIINQCPIVLGVLLNNVLDRYSTAGVNYVEFSVSLNDLMNKEIMRIIRYEVHTTSNEKKDIVNNSNENSQEQLTRSRSLPPPKKLKPAPLFPHMPKLFNAQQNPAPLWRKYDIQYHSKNRYQTHCFLAAMNRNKDVKLPYIDENYQFSYKSNFALSPLNAYQSLGELLLPPNFKFVVETLVAYNFSMEGLPLALGITTESPEECAIQHKHLFDDGSLFCYVELLAKYLCSNDAIEHMFPNMFNDGVKLGRNIVKMKNNVAECAQSIVGFDWVGDELGYPYCALNHDMFINLIKEFQKTNPKFGVRLHAGEGVMRPATIDDSPDVKVAFALHMCILCETIRSLCEKLYTDHTSSGARSGPLSPCSIRVGHGVAFLYGYDEVTYNTDNGGDWIPTESGVASQASDPFMFQLKKHLAKFRNECLIGRHIVTELNPTSNHLLLSDTFIKGESLGNNRTLSVFLKEKLPVVLCTDDDGIWAIHKCPQHHNHISVAHEYCQAIHNGEIETVEQLQQMFADGRNSAFAPV